MKKFILSSLVAILALAAQAQNVQLHYDFGRDIYSDEEAGRQKLTLTLEQFKADRFGSWYYFVDFDLSRKFMEGAYTEISRALNFWKNSNMKNWSLHAEYNGGIYASYPINNAWLFGVEYFMHDKSFKNVLTLEALYKTIRKTDQNVPM